MNEISSEDVAAMHGELPEGASPMSNPALKQLKARGMLAGRRPVVSREVEKASYAKMLEERYADSL